MRCAEPRSGNPRAGQMTSMYQLGKAEKPQPLNLASIREGWTKPPLRHRSFSSSGRDNRNGYGTEMDPVPSSLGTTKNASRTSSCFIVENRHVCFAHLIEYGRDNRNGYGSCFFVVAYHHVYVSHSVWQPRSEAKQIIASTREDRIAALRCRHISSASFVFIIYLHSKPQQEENC